MGNLQEQLAKIEQDLSAEKQKGPEGDQTIIARLESEQAHILEQIMLAEQQEREQKIEEKVAAIELPYDFNELYDNSTANDTIIEIVQQFKRQDLEEHDADIEKLHQLYREQLRASGEREIQLQRQNDGMQASLTVAHAECERVNADNEELHKAVSRLEFDLQDAEFKRDNSASQLEQAQAEINQLKSWNDDLHRQIANGVRGELKVIESSQTLDQLIQRANEEKQAKIKSSMELALENSAPFRGKISLPEIKQQENQFRDFPAIEPNGNQLPSAQVDATVGPQFPSAPNIETVHAPDLATGNVSGESTHEQVEAGQGTDGEAPVTRAEFEALKQKVSYLHDVVHGDNKADVA